MSFAAPYLAVLDVKVALDGKAIFVEPVVHIQLRLLSPYLDMHLLIYLSWTFVTMVFVNCSHMEAKYIAHLI